jgi:hypothetical protein
MSKDTLNKKVKSKKTTIKNAAKLPKHLEHLNLMAAGIEALLRNYLYKLTSLNLDGSVAFRHSQRCHFIERTTS